MRERKENKLFFLSLCYFSHMTKKSKDRLQHIANHLNPNKKDEALEKSEWKVTRLISIFLFNKQINN